MTRPETVRRRLPVEGSDGGFTMIELLTAIGVFGILMVVVGATTLSGFSAIREANSRSAIQQESQNSMEWVSRLLRYAKSPNGLLNAMPEATATAVTVYTYSGTGRKEDVPYRVRVFAKPATTGTGTWVVSQITTPKWINGAWDWTTAPVETSERILLRIPSGSAGSAVGFTYYACTPTVDCAATRRLVTPGTSGPLTLGVLEVPESVIVSIGDPTLPGTRVTQAVKLVNLT
jgi:prepilin-type N-terminal cleavage/methylation domain-containing protein